MFGTKLFILLSTAIIGLSPTSFVEADCSATVSPVFGGAYGALPNRAIARAALIASSQGYSFHPPAFQQVGRSNIRSEIFNPTQVRYHLFVKNDGGAAKVTAQVAWFDNLSQAPLMIFTVTATANESNELCIVVDSSYTRKITNIQMYTE